MRKPFSVPIDYPEQKTSKHFEMRSTKTTSANCLVVILVILVILILAGVGVNFIRKQIQGRFSGIPRSNTEWTPDRIGKDPVGYMTWASGQLDALDQRCVAEGIRLNAKLLETKNRLAYSREALALQVSDTQALAATYRETEASAGWPVSFRNRSWEKTDLEDELLRLDSLSKANREMIPALEKAETAIPLMLPQLEDRRRKISALKVRVKTARDIADLSALSSSAAEITAEAEKIGNYTAAIQAMALSTLPGADSTQVRIDQQRREAALEEILNP